jgi:hypothetical protein
LKRKRLRIKVRVLNGDGAKWISGCTNTAEKHCQLDRFHIFKAILWQVYDKKEAKKIARLIKSGNVQKALARIEELKYECGGECDKVEKLQNLEECLKSNLDGLILYHERDNLELPEPPEGIKNCKLLLDTNIRLLIKIFPYKEEQE